MGRPTREPDLDELMADRCGDDCRSNAEDDKQHMRRAQRGFAHQLQADAAEGIKCEGMDEVKTVADLAEPDEWSGAQRSSGPAFPAP